MKRSRPAPIGSQKKRLREPLKALPRLPPPPKARVKPRFEDEVGIELRCCGGELMDLKGNLSLREAGEAGLGCTMLGYECGKCFRRVMVADEWPNPGRSVFLNDDVP
jgi:hypothetical protein